MTIPPLDRLVAFVKERQLIYERRDRGEPKPWTKDHILQTVRFSNVLRENDTVTKWIAQNWRDPHHDLPDLWFAMCVARLVNEPNTLEAVGFPVDRQRWRRGAFERIVSHLQKTGVRVWNPAYNLSTCGKKMTRIQYQLELFDTLWDSRKTLRPKEKDTLRSYHVMLGQFWGLGSFLSAQVIADLKYAKDTPLERAADWHTFAASGPGSRRGMLRLHDQSFKSTRAGGGPPAGRDGEDAWYLKLQRLRNDIMPRLKGTKLYNAHAQDIQGWLCEWDKYERVRLNDGSAKQSYPGRA